MNLFVPASEASSPPAAGSFLSPGLSTQGHWAFQPLRRDVTPATRNGRWPVNDVDRFVLARLEKAGYAPTGFAEKRILIRRATFDLTGLPPTPEEVERFLRDRSPRAFERLVDRLLASPHYGERWGRQWLDVARYADTAGDSADYPIPQARLYRDYVIASFNQDKPYDQFLREQIAGDLLPNRSEEEKKEHIIATGFIALSRRFATDTKGTEHLIIEDTLDTMGRGILGLALSCARCHDHKHDPISTQDYYGLYGIFASTRYPHPGSEVRKYQTNFVPLISQSEVEARLKPYREKVAALDAEIARMDAQLNFLHKEGLDTEAMRPEYEKVWKARDALSANPPRVETAYAVADDGSTNARVQRRGVPWDLGDEVPRRFLKVLGGSRVPDSTPGSGRLELAGWLTDPANPLTARVMVNRIWQGHFGHGLVRTLNDFGAHGSLPTHPELLDYLARKFIESGWSVKAMHRLILLSATYQQAAADLREGDPGRGLLSGFPRRRLDAEQLRDAQLFVSGELDLEPGGAHPFPPEHTWNFTQHDQFNAVYETRKRTVYLMQQRIRRHPFMALFDGADPNVCTGERTTTTTPLQALFSLNDPLVHERAESFAARLLEETSDDAVRIDRAHQLAFGRSARRDEIEEGLRYIQRATATLRNDEAADEELRLDVWSSYARALLGSNEFLYLD